LLATLGGAAAAACSAGSASAPATLDGGASDAGVGAPLDARGPRQRVAVVGGGLAGLGAAWTLAELGHEVTVLEAQGRVGGRVLTLRDPGWGKDVTVEAGALAFRETDERVMALVRALALPIVELAGPASGARAYSVGGRRFVHRPPEPWPVPGMSSGEQALGPALEAEYLKADLAEIGDPRQPGWPRAGALPFDAKTMREHLAARGASEPWLDLLQAERGGEMETLSALAGLSDLALRPATATRALAIAGGNDRLTLALAERLGARVKTRSPVVRIEHGGSTLKVFYREPFGDSGAETPPIALECDHLVLAVPMPSIRRIELAPAFSSEKAAAIAELDMLPAARLFLQTRSRFWKDDPLGALGGLIMLATDSRIVGRVADVSALSLPEGSTLGMLTGLVDGQGAAELAAVGPDARVGAYRAKLADAYPHDASEITRADYHLWGDHDPWIGGAWASPRKGQLTRMAAVLRRAEGRVHFAGEHTSPHRGSLEGAMESALRCADEIEHG